MGEGKTNTNIFQQLNLFSNKGISIYVSKSIQINVVTDEGNSRNEM